MYQYELELDKETIAINTYLPICDNRWRTAFSTMCLST